MNRPRPTDGAPSGASASRQFRASADSDATGSDATGSAAPGSGTAAFDGTGRAHGKVILLGEHAVVHGEPAIAMPVPSIEVTAQIRAAEVPRIDSELYVGPLAGAPDRLRPVLAALRAASAFVGLPAEHAELTIRSTVPVGRGLGSSAAVAAAVVAAVADAAGTALSAQERHDLVQDAERVAHGTPSGIDARTVVAPAPIRFQGGRATDLTVGAPMHFVLADSGRGGSTSQALAGVRDLRTTSPGLVEAAVSRLGVLSEDAATALAGTDPAHRAALGAGMREAHDLLRRLGVSSPVLDALVGAAHAAGAPGAKLTGGGLGGCVLALAPSADESEAMAAALTAAGADRVWTMTLEASR